MEDKRKFNVTNKVFEVLNNVKGFDVAMSNPKKGMLIVKHEGISFYVSIEPIFNDNAAGRELDSRSFEDIVRTHSNVFN